MAATARLGPPLRSTGSWLALAPLTARALQIGWLLLQLGAVALALLATPAVHARFQTTCPEALCDVLPQLNPQSIALLARLGIPLHAYASVMVGVEWFSLLIWAGLGAVIVWKRPRDLVALLIAYGGVVGSSKVFLDALGDGFALPATIGLVVSAVTLPLLLALFPDGHWAPLWTRWVVLAAAGYGVVALLAGAPPPALLTVLELPLGVAPFAVLIGAQVYRYRRVSGPIQRQQTKWVVFGLSVYISNFIVASLAFVLGWAAAWQFVFLAFCYGGFIVLGVSITAAILRYRLFDIDVILSRTMVYGALTVAVVAIYALIVGGLSLAFQTRGSAAVALFATAVVAVVFQPLRERIQRGVNRLLFGDRDDPYAALSRLGQRLETALAPEEILPAIVRTMTETLRLPYAAIVLNGGSLNAPAAAAGAPVPDPMRFPLVYQAERVGELVVAPRGPGETFSAADRRLLADLARQIGVAVHSVQLTSDLQRSRERIVSAREEERRRLRRDLHDGLGAQLAALALQASALRAMIARDPAAAQEQASELRQELKAAVADIRRLVHGLRPPALDELGLVGALHQQADRLRIAGSPGGAEDGAPALAISIVAPDPLPPLPAAVEVAVYRIVDEALINVAKHAAANACVIRFAVGSVLTVTVEDDGIGCGPERGAGVGLHSMRERAEELGGSFEMMPRDDGAGTIVKVSIPLSSQSGG